MSRIQARGGIATQHRAVRASGWSRPGSGLPLIVVQVLERGDITFFYRPLVQSADARTFRVGVQSFFAVLSPGERALHRRLRIGRKRMPARPGERLWARVERVGSLDRVLAGQLEAEHYMTKTRGERFQPEARPIAQGSYAVVRHDDHCHLVYRIEHHEEDEDIPAEVRVPDAASHLLLFERAPGAGATWSAAGDPDQLDEEGAEVVLVGAEDEPERELGIDILPASVERDRD